MSLAEFSLQTLELDLAPLVAAFGRRLHEAGVPVSAERAARFARALSLVRPLARRRLYWTARAVFVSDLSQVSAFDAVFAEVFAASPAAHVIAPEDTWQVPAPPDRRLESERRHAPSEAAPPEAWSAGSSPAAGERRRPEHESPPVSVPTIASDAEAIRGKRFDALEPEELTALYRLMAELALVTPARRTRRFERAAHGARIDLRRSLRASLRTGGDPIRLARRQRRILPRRLVLLCDISGSMEPYTRAYLQFLTCAAAAGPRAEAFAFATRLTRLTRALQSRNPERAIQQAAAAAPDWSSGTRIADALKTFNDRHGRRGMARGAVIVILSDGWERGDPALVGREMARLGRLAYRIVWVNPRAAATGFSPRAGGMVAALPHCDALVSGHSLDALEQVIVAIADRRGHDASAGTDWSSPPAPEPADEPWASATPVPGSSVAMPSGYGPSRGRTTPGWGSG